MFRTLSDLKQNQKHPCSHAKLHNPIVMAFRGPNENVTHEHEHEHELLNMNNSYWSSHTNLA